MYHQLLPIGEGQILAEIEYEICDDTGVMWIDKIKKVGGAEVDTGMFEQRQIEDIEGQLWKRHDNVVREMNLQARADRAADNAAFREVYA